jgi:hypothetical protein
MRIGERPANLKRRFGEIHAHDGQSGGSIHLGLLSG